MEGLLIRGATHSKVWFIAGKLFEKNRYYVAMEPIRWHDFDELVSIHSEKGAEITTMYKE